MKPIEILINAKDNASKVFSSIAEAANGLAGRIAAAFAIGSMAQSAAEIETLEAGLKAVSGSAEQAGKDMEFVRRMAATAGVDVVEAGRAYLSLAAATKGTAVEGEATRRVFESVTNAMAKAGKGSAETSNALQALAQMAGKGQVQMEELRGQLGEALPGALNAAAAGLGVTTKELSDLVEQGQITAQDLFPALTKGLNDLYGAAGGAQTLSQELANTKNAFTDLASDIGNAGGLSALKLAAEIAQSGLVLLNDTLVRTGKSIGAVFGALATMDFSGLKQAFADIEAEGRDKLLRAAAHNETLRKALNLTADESLKLALAQQQAGDTATQAGAKAGASADLWIRLNSGYGQVLTSVRDQIAAAEKAVIAREAEGKASVAVAAAFGIEAEKRAAQAAAAEMEAAALRDLAQLRQTELTTMQTQLEALKQEATEHGKLSNERAKQLAELEKQIALRQQDTDKAMAQAQAARLVAEQAKATAEALRDNSDRVEELKRAWEDTRAVLEGVRAAQAAGMATLEQVTQAELAAGRAVLLYRDALSDQLKSIKAKADAQRSSVDLEAASVQLAIAQQRAVYELARARGDEAGAISAANELRKLEIQLAELSAKAKRAEGEAALALVAAKRAELEAAGQLTAVKRLELDAAEKAAQVKLKEAEIAEATAKGLRDLADAHRNLGLDASRAAGGIHGMTSALGSQREALQANMDAIDEINMRYKLTADFTERQIALLEREAAAAEKAAEAKRKYWNVDKDGFTLDANGQRQQMTVPTGEFVFNSAKNAGLSEADALALMDKFFQNGKPTGVNDANGLNGPSKDWFSIVADAISKLVIEKARQNVANPQGGSNTTGSSTAPAAPRPGPSAGGSGSGSGMGSGVSINLYPGVDFSSRTEAERIARFIAPALKDLQRKGAI